MDHGWFKVQIKDPVNVTNNDNVQSTSLSVETGIETNTNKENLSLKREHDESNETESKRLKISEADESSVSDAVKNTSAENEQTINVSTSENTSYDFIPESEIKNEPLEANSEGENRCNTSNNSKIVIKTEPVEDETDKNNLADTKVDNNSDTAIKEEPPEVNNDHVGTDIDINNTDIALVDSLQRNNDNTSTKDDIEKDVKEEKEDNEDTCKKTDDGKASTSGTNRRVWRDRCWYGNSCYR